MMECKCKINTTRNVIYIFGRSTSLTQYFFRNKWRNDSNLMRLLKVNPELKEKLNKRNIEGKHKYLLPLDNEMKKSIIKLAKPYPKRAGSIDSDATSSQEE